MSAVLDHHDAHGHDDHHDHHAPTGWRRWVYATNHKDIGTLYLLFAFTMLMVGGVLALLIRAELFQPGLQLVNPELFNQLTTMHGLIMVFGAIMPAFVGFANWMIPLQIGASDMAFARMNNFSFWLMVPAGLMLVGSFFMPGGAPAAGWTLYAPLTLQMGPSMDAGIFAMHILGASSIMGSINIIVTILNMRAKAMSLAPICSGTIQFAKPTKAGMMAPNTMIRPCIVVSWLNSCGFTICRPGWNSSARISSASTPPIISIVNENSRYSVPMSLWFVANIHRRQPCGWSWA